MSADEIYDFLVKWGPWIGGLATFALPFLYTLAKDANTRRIEAQKPHLERQLKLYTEACQVVVSLATSDDKDARAKAERRFWELYWGELCMVEDRRVEKAMKDFGDVLKAGGAEDKLKDASYNLAHALRHSLEVAWGFRFRRMLPY